MSFRTMTCRSGVAAALLAGVPSLAAAHTGVNAAHDLAHGWLHVLAGADHLLAMLAVGLWAAQRGGRSVWGLPAAFVGALVAGYVLAAAGIGMAGVEPMIVGSLLVLGALVAAAVRMPLPWAAIVVAGFAVFHGHAHGTEMTAGALAVTYGTGLALATAVLHGAGVAFVLMLRGRVSGRIPFERMAGAAIAAAGALLLIA